jgi:hypothetical protein
LLEAVPLCPDLRTGIGVALVAAGREHGLESMRVRMDALCPGTKVVGAEGEELRGLRDVASVKRSTTTRSKPCALSATTATQPADRKGWSKHNRLVRCSPYPSVLPVLALRAMRDVSELALDMPVSAVTCSCMRTVVLVHVPTEV